MSKFVSFTRLLMLGGATLLFVSSDALAGGFAVQEQSTRGLGQAFTGVTTGLGDGSSAWYNPAAMTKLDGDVAHVGASLILPVSDFNDTGSSLAAPLGGGAVTGNDGGNGGEPGLVPNIFFVKGLADDRLKLGFAVNAPFGLTTDYEATWKGRYHGIESRLTTINLNPSVGFEVNEHFSIGAGVSAQYGEAKLTNAIDFGTIAFSALGADRATAAGFSPQGNDGFAEVEGDDWGLGYNVGALFTYEDTQLGVAYRSHVDLDLRGSANFTVPTNATPLTAMGSFVDTSALASARMPETITADITHNFSDDLQVSFNALWTRWTRLDELRIQFGSAQADNVTPLSWDNTWRFAAGTNYRVHEDWVLRFGLSYEDSPIKSGAFRTPRIPDNDRFWTTVGASYQLCDNAVLDFSYAHVFAQDAGSNVQSGTGDTLLGNYDLSVDIVAAALTWNL